MMPLVLISKTGTMCFRPLVDVRNTVVVASRTRLDGSWTDLCRRTRRVISGPFAFDTPQRPVVTRCDVRNIVPDAFVSDVRRWRF